MNIELAMIEPEYRNQSARLCLSLDSFLQEHTADYVKCQELSQNYLKERCDRHLFIYLFITPYMEIQIDNTIRLLDFFPHEQIF